MFKLRKKIILPLLALFTPLALASEPTQSANLTFLRMVDIGISHIFSGTDHLLFILGIGLIPGVLANWRSEWLKILKLITAFTVGHAASIVLGYFEIISLSSLFVELGIALSIAIIGVENILAQKGRYNLSIDRRMIVLGFFGLIHGLGFAGVLNGLTLPQGKEALLLLGFNIGVELGQVFWKIGVSIALIGLIYKLGEGKVINYTSAFIFLSGCYWFVFRLVEALVF